MNPFIFLPHATVGILLALSIYFFYLYIKTKQRVLLVTLLGMSLLCCSTIHLWLGSRSTEATVVKHPGSLGAIYGVDQSQRAVPLDIAGLALVGGSLSIYAYSARR